MAQEAVRFAAGPLQLEGLLELPEPGDELAGIVMCHPHPQMGGDMYNQVVDLVCEAMTALGIASLRFNFRGTGRSQGAYSGGEGEREDVWAALDFLRTHPGIESSRIGLAGYSFGAAVALNCAAAAGVRGLAAISAPPRLLDFDAQRGVELPVLLISGELDPYVPADRARALADAIGPNTTIAIVPGIDHFWGGGEVALQTAVGEFFRTALLAAPHTGDVV